MEYFTLPAQARYSDLLVGVVEEHPAISAMIPSMMVLIDGVPAKATSSLSDGDEVDFIPAVAGG
jgi:molybdopterin converting factor small subunit